MEFGIGSRQILLLKAALSPDKAEAAVALDEWWAQIADYDAVRGTDANLFPQIYWNLGSRIRDPRLHARLRGTARHHWVRNQYLIASGGRLLEVLEQADVPVLLLKGAAIAASIDDDSGLRAMSDCDMLVPKNRALEVLELLAASNLLEPGKAGARDLDIVHGITLGLRKTRHAVFDLHWRPLRPVGAEELAHEMFADAVPVDFAGRRCLAPCPEHLVFHAIVHGIEWSPFPRYDWLVDTIKILRRSAAAFEWGKLMEIALSYRFGFAIGAALKEARDKSGLAVPGAVLRGLRSPLAVLERLEGRARLSRPSSRSVADEMLLALQDIRRQDRDRLRRSALGAVPPLVQWVLGPFSESRSFIHNDREERITYLHGWSAPEATGRWTEGRLICCALHAPGGRRPTSMTLRGWPFAHQASAPHIVDVFAGMRRLGTLRWRKSGRRPYVQEVHLPPAIWRGKTAIIRFHVRRPVSPIETGYNGDTRALGIFVERVSVDPALRDAADRSFDFSCRGSDLDVLWHGWSHPEAQGCWSDGKAAVLRWRAARTIARGSCLHVDIAGVAGGRPVVEGHVLVNERRLTSFRHPAEPSGMRISIQLPADVAAGQDVAIRFDLQEPHVRSTSDGGSRHKGLSVRRIWVEPPAAQS